MNSGRKIVTSIAANPGAVKPCFVGRRMQSALGLRRKIAGASVVVALVAAGLTAVPASAVAQTPKLTTTLHCLNVGNNPPEALGDRTGHAIQKSEIACTVEGGPADGGVMWGTAIWEWDGINGVGKAGFGVTRFRGGHIVYVNTEMKNTLTMVEGKVTGFAMAGRGYYPVATGAAASFQGKTYTYVSKPGPGPGRFVLETTID